MTDTVTKNVHGSYQICTGKKKKKKCKGISTFSRSIQKRIEVHGIKHKHV